MIHSAFSHQVSALAILALVAHAAPTPETSEISSALIVDEDDLDVAFVNWKAEHGREYISQAQHDARRVVFAQNKVLVEQHNARGESWTMALNKFADLTTEEFAERMGFLGGVTTMGTNVSSAPERHVTSAEDPPASIDWRTKDIVNPIKDQAQCGSCWAFSAVDSYESAVATKTGTLVSFSEQELVDCAKNVKVPGSSQTCCDGCDGGLMDYAFEYWIKETDGLDKTEASYPYKARAHKKCKKTGDTTGAAPVTSYKDITMGDEDALVDACGKIGVISVAVNAGINGWQLYEKGLFDPKKCDPKQLDHGVAVVGYGSTSDGQDYWIIRNSWGESWGEDGYMRMSRGKNTCGVSNSAVYPVV